MALEMVDGGIQGIVRTLDNLQYTAMINMKAVIDQSPMGGSSEDLSRILDEAHAWSELADEIANARNHVNQSKVWNSPRPEVYAPQA